MPRLTTPKATNFYYSFVFLPKEKRRAIEAVYAFARRGDDVADSDLDPDVARQALDQYREALDACYDGRMREWDAWPELEALAETVQHYRISRCHFEDFILGLEMDLAAVRYQTIDQLALYCYRVASTIGLISIEIFGYRDPRTRDYAVHLGRALQMVNILRDLGSDARHGRVYLPCEDLDRFAVEPKELVEERKNDRLGELVRFECDRARRYFDAARQALPEVDRPSMVAAEIMAAIYWKLLERIERNANRVLMRRVRLARPLKVWTALSVYLGTEWQR